MTTPIPSAPLAPLRDQIAKLLFADYDSEHKGGQLEWFYPQADRILALPGLSPSNREGVPGEAPPSPLDPAREYLAAYDRAMQEGGSVREASEKLEIMRRALAVLPLGAPGTVEKLEDYLKGVKSRQGYLDREQARKVEPSASRPLRDAKRVEEPGYRRLVAGEVVLSTDQYLCYDGMTWGNIDGSSYVGGLYNPSECQPMRRRAETERSEVPKPKAEGSTPESSPERKG
jgi:hypothetical protein